MEDIEVVLTDDLLIIGQQTTTFRIVLFQHCTTTQTGASTFKRTKILLHRARKYFDNASIKLLSEHKLFFYNNGFGLQGEFMARISLHPSALNEELVPLHLFIIESEKFHHSIKNKSLFESYCPSKNESSQSETGDSIVAEKRQVQVLADKIIFDCAWSRTRFLHNHYFFGNLSNSGNIAVTVSRRNINIEVRK